MPDNKSHLTTGEIAAMLGVPGWAVRRAVDTLGENVPRAGLYRLVPREMLGRVREQLAAAGYPSEEPANA
jgi:hypothetical protein